jgi:nucleoside-diphosphate-sugar epimerase
MKVLVTGGSGIVGTLVVPILARTHTVRVYDLRPPESGSFDYFQGDVTDFDALAQAMAGMDALLYLAMGNLKWDEISGHVTAFDVNVKGVHLALKAAHEAGVTQAVYASSMSVYGDDLMKRYFENEDVPPDSTGLYGFTKRLGEEVCQNAALAWGMNVNALRLCFPQAEERWLKETLKGKPTIATTADDVARAMAAALEYKVGFQTFMISGDYEQKIMNMGKAKRLLGWEPLARPTRKLSTAVKAKRLGKKVLGQSAKSRKKGE